MTFMAEAGSVHINILVVDDDATSLAVVSAMLKTWKYQVVTAKTPFEALDTLRAKRGLFDLVVTDLHMPQMTGFELQKQVKEEFQLPVIMMSADDKDSVILKCLEQGAAFYMVKPVSPDDLKHVWQYAVASKKGKSPELRQKKKPSTSNNLQPRSSLSAAKETATSSSSNGRNELGEGEASVPKRKGVKRPREKEEVRCQKSQRNSKVVWTDSLHNRFLQAIKDIGLDKAVPRRILDNMNVPGLTRENVASHLQKYRIFLRKVAERGSLSSSKLFPGALRASFYSAIQSLNSNNLQPAQYNDHFSRRQQQITDFSAHNGPPNSNYSMSPSWHAPSPLLNSHRSMGATSSNLLLNQNPSLVSNDSASRLSMTPQLQQSPNFCNRRAETAFCSMNQLLTSIGEIGSSSGGFRASDQIQGAFGGANALSVVLSKSQQLSGLEEEIRGGDRILRSVSGGPIFDNSALVQTFGKDYLSELLLGQDADQSAFPENQVLSRSSSYLCGVQDQAAMGQQPSQQADEELASGYGFTNVVNQADEYIPSFDHLHLNQLADAGGFENNIEFGGQQAQESTAPEYNLAFNKIFDDDEFLETLFGGDS